MVADIPGLVEGAARGRGLGHQFLRHVERARVLLVLLDLAPIDGRSPLDSQLEVLLRELGRYRPELLERPRLVVGSKADAGRGPETSRSIRTCPDGPARDGHEVSAATGEGLRELVRPAGRPGRRPRAGERAGVAHAGSWSTALRRRG